MYESMYVCMYVCMCVYIYMYMYIQAERKLILHGCPEQRFRGLGV